MSNEEPKFEYGKWYYFKDEASEAEFRRLNSNNVGNPDNSRLADIIVNAEGFCPVKVAAGYVLNVDLAYGGNTDMVLYPGERKFFMEMLEDDKETEEHVETSFEPSDFPLTTISISNNSEAWTVYQMLKAHFKE